MSNLQMKPRFRFTFLMLLILSVGVFSAFGQENGKEKETKKKNDVQPAVNLDLTKGNPTADQIAEATILIYGGLGGRTTLDQIRKTTVERGKMTVTNPDDSVDNINYEFLKLPAENLEKGKYRLNQEFPNARYSLIYDGEKTFGLFNETIFEPKENSAAAFRNQIRHGLDVLLRYRENGSKVELAGRDKIFGVEFFILDVTDKDNRKTRFYVSIKTYRVMMLEYEEEGIKYKRKFYDYNYSQGTLVPYRTVLWANDKQVEESQVKTITFGQKIEDAMFVAVQN